MATSGSSDEGVTVPIERFELACRDYCLGTVKLTVDAVWAAYARHERAQGRAPSDELGKAVYDAAQALALRIKQRHEEGFFAQTERDWDDARDHGLPFDASRGPGRFFDAFR